MKILTSIVAMLFVVACSSDPTTENSVNSGTMSQADCSQEFGGIWKITPQAGMPKLVPETGSICQTFVFGRETGTVAEDGKVLTVDIGSGKLTEFEIQPFDAECNLLVASRSETRGDTNQKQTYTLRRQPDGSLAGELQIDMTSDPPIPSSPDCSVTFTVTATR